nr:radical SAM protein [uncultured Lachnoclostridium sp.]
MKILIMNPSSGEMLDNSLSMPLTVYHLAGVLRNAGHEVSIVDEMIYLAGRMDLSLEEAMKKYTSDIDALVFSSNTFNWAKGLDNCKRLRKAGYEGLIIAGGVHPSLAYEHIMTNFSEYIDFIMMGDAEYNLLPLLKRFEQGKGYDDIPGIVYSENGRVVKHDLPCDMKLIESNDGPAYDMVPNGVYKTITFECSRGCLGHCAFCSIPFRRNWRPYSMEHIEKTLQLMIPHISKIEGKPTIITTDDCFTTDSKRAIEIVKMFMDYGLRDYNVHLEARVMDLKNEDFLDLLTDFPSIDLELGVECGYDRGLRAVHKPLTVEMLYNCCELLNDYGLEKNVYSSFIVGMPHESFEECYQTVNTARDLFNTYGVFSAMSFWAPLPSESFELLKTKVPDLTYGIFDNINWSEDQELHYKCHPNLTREQSDQLKRDTYIIKNQV